MKGKFQAYFTHGYTYKNMKQNIIKAQKQKCQDSLSHNKSM